MIIKNRTRKTVNWDKFILVYGTVVSFLRNLQSKQSNLTPPAKISRKKIALIIFTTIILWTFLVSYMIYRNTPKDVVTELADLIGMQARKNKKKTKDSLKAVILQPLKWISGKFQGADLPQVSIDIKFKHYRKLQEKRKNSLKQGVIISTEDDYIPAKIRYEGKTIKIKLRLKGDWTDHLKGKKWSFRVHVKGKDHFLGMRRFSLHNPAQRSYDGEILYFQALKREGILAPRYFFIDLTVNGEKIGLMALEEHFSKELLESQNRRDGVILKFDESLVWQAKPDIFKQRGFGGAYDNYKNATIKPFRLKHIERSKKLSDELKVATGLLRAFVDGTMKPSQVFDPDLMGRFIAISDFWATWHGCRWHNLRFYYNSITGYLEPIGYDAKIPYNIKPEVNPLAEPVVARLLDSSIRAVYMETFKRLILESKNGTTSQWVTPLTDINMKILHREFPFLDAIDLDIFTQWGEEKLARNITSDLYPKILQIYFVNNELVSFLELQNPLPYDVVVSNIRLVSPDKALDFKESSSLPLNIPKAEQGGLPNVKRIHFNKNDIAKGSQVEVTANIVGEKTEHTIEAIPYFQVATKNVVPQSTLIDTLAKHSFLTADQNERILRVKPGQWKVETLLIIPKGFELIVPKGTVLRFKPSAGLVARGPVTIQGTRERPVTFEGSEISKNAGYWQGIVVLNSTRPSHWSHVLIKNTEGIRYKNWVVNAGVTFYKSDVHLKHAIFEGNRSEDALNIVRSTFELQEVNIANAVSDGFDADFSNGTVTAGKFENLGYSGGGDAIDVSGSRVTVSGTQFHSIADKAISVGEESHMEATDLLIENVGVGVVSKDGSRTTISNSQINEAQLAGLMTYIKKSIYPPATLHANNITFKQSNPNALAQKGNEIILDGTAIKPKKFDVDKLYKTSMQSGLK